MSKRIGGPEQLRMRKAYAEFSGNLAHVLTDCRCGRGQAKKILTTVSYDVLDMCRRRRILLVTDDSDSFTTH